MVACQGVVLPGQLTPLKICYGKAKDSMLGSAAPGDAPAGPGPAAGAGAVAAAASVYAPDPRAAAGPLGWKPKEFNPDGSVKDEQQQPADQPAAAGSAGPEPGSEAAAISAAAAAAAGVDAGTIQAMTQAGFQYQACSGYWWDPKSGYFYDAATQLYYHHSTSQWYQYSADTGQYTAVGGEQQQQHGQGQGQQQGGAAQGQQQQQKPAAAADKRRRAVIGSAPQYNPEGVLAAAALAQVSSSANDAPDHHQSICLLCLQACCWGQSFQMITVSALHLLRANCSLASTCLPTML
jgi:RNA-binding protein 5/10